MEQMMLERVRGRGERKLRSRILAGRQEGRGKKKGKHRHESIRGQKGSSEVSIRGKKRLVGMTDS